MSMSQAIVKAISDLRSRRTACVEEIAKLHAEVADLDAGIRALEMAFNGGYSSGTHLTPVEQITKSQDTESNQRSPAPTSVRRRERPLAKAWADILKFVGSKPGGMSLDLIMDMVDLVGYEVSRNTLRSQMHTYRKRGWVQSVGEGVYRLTSSGASKCGLQMNEAADGATSAASKQGVDSAS